MMELVFTFGSDIVFVRVEGTNIQFGNSSQGAFIAPIQNLKLSQEGAIKEFPDLVNDKMWKEKAIERFKDKIKALQTEEERCKYIIEDLKKFGYTPKYKQKKGHRPERIN